MSDGLDSLGSIRRQAMLLLLAAFVAGGLLGGALDRVWMMRRMPRDGGPGRPPFGRMRGEGDVPGILVQLGLTDDQRDRIRRILNDGRPHIDQVVRETQAPVRAVLDSLEGQIRAVLRPEQLARLDSLAPPPGPNGERRGFLPRPGFGRGGGRRPEGPPADAPPP